jgi:hypothetical protein
MAVFEPFTSFGIKNSKKEEINYEESNKELIKKNLSRIFGFGDDSVAV